MKTDIGRAFDTSNTPDTVYYWHGFPESGSWKEAPKWLHEGKLDSLIIALGITGQVAVKGSRSAGPPLTPPSIRQFRTAGVIADWRNEDMRNEDMRATN